MICGELDRLTPAAFQTELCDCLVDYYERVCGMAGVGGVTSVQKRKFAAKTAAAADADEIDTEGASSQQSTCIPVRACTKRVQMV